MGSTPALATKWYNLFMEIGLDFDGVIMDCGQLKSDGAKKIYGFNISPSQFKKEIVIGQGLLTAAQYRDLQKIIYETREVGFLMQPVSDVLIYLPKLIEQGHKVKVITSRENQALEIAQQWSNRKGLNLNFVGVGYGNDKTGAATGLDLYVDDDLDKLTPLVGVVPHRFLFSWGYNAHINPGSVANKISSWRELYNTVRSIKK